MAIRTDDDLEKVFTPIINKVVENMAKRIDKLLTQHINTDTYGINKNVTGTPPINLYYLGGDGTANSGTPSYEFRDFAWSMKVSQGVFSLFFDSGRMSPPSQSKPFLHGNIYAGEDRRAQLAEILNVSGEAPHGDFDSGKNRQPFWDNFLDDLNLKIGGWLYTEFNNQGLKIPALRIFKGGM